MSDYELHPEPVVVASCGGRGEAEIINVSNMTIGRDHSFEKSKKEFRRLRYGVLQISVTRDLELWDIMIFANGFAGS